MNKRFFVLIIFVGIISLFFSFSLRNFILKRSMRLIGKADLENLNMLYENGRAFYSRGDYDKAIRFFEAVVTRFPNRDLAKKSLLNMADCYRAKEDYLKLKDTLKGFIARFPDSENVTDIQKDLENLNIRILFSDIITDDSFLYEITEGDALTKIASRFNTTVEILKKSNNLKTDLIRVGRTLKVNRAKFNGVVDKSENTLTLRNSKGETIKTYYVSTGENFSTPTGTFKIEEKLKSPIWYKVGAVVAPDSPEYELGSRWMGLSKPGYGIHGTKDTSSIGKHVTKGCIRMTNKDIEELYAIVPSGTEVIIVE